MVLGLPMRSGAFSPHPHHTTLQFTPGNPVSHLLAFAGSSPPLSHLSGTHIKCHLLYIAFPDCFSPNTRSRVLLGPLSSSKHQQCHPLRVCPLPLTGHLEGMERLIHHPGDLSCLSVPLPFATGKDRPCAVLIEKTSVNTPWFQKQQEDMGSPSTEI